VGRERELRALLAELSDATRREPESTGFEVLADDDPGEFVLLISWQDESGLRDHYATPHYLRYREHVGPLLARPSDVVMHHISATVHPRDPNPPEPGMFG
jgi:quinol monooxygenase YgiN